MFNYFMPHCITSYKKKKKKKKNDLQISLEYERKIFQVMNIYFFIIWKFIPFI